MPTRSRSSRLVAVALGLGLAAGCAVAHEPGADALPDEPGWKAGAALAMLLPRAEERWPTAAWPGVLINGSAPRDQRGGLRLEHGTLDLAARVNATWGVAVSAGWHDREPVHTEAALLQGRWSRGEHDYELRLGRDTVRMGAVIDSAGHFDRFSQVPLAKRATVNGQWIDDGLALAWRRSEADGLRALELGLWRGRAFPGGPSGPAVPSLHLHTGRGHVDAHLAVAHFEPEGRGAAAQSAGAVGHVHGSLDCRSSLQLRVCVDGRVDLLGGSLQWEPEASDWTLAVAGLWRRERGAIYSGSGDAAWHSRVGGAWVDVGWQATPRWRLNARAERLVANNRLEGVGTVLLAQAAGLSGAAPVSRWTAAAQFAPREQWVFSLEAGQERHAAGRGAHAALRLIWRQPRWLGAQW